MITKRPRRNRERAPEAKEAEAPKAAPEAAENDNSQPNEPKAADGSTRISVALYRDKDGNIQWDRMHGKSRDQLKKIVTDPAVAKGLGIEKSESGPSGDVEVFNPEWCKGLYKAMGQVESIVAQKTAKVPAHIANQVFKFSDAEVEALTPATVKVINKWAPEWFKKFADEIALAMLIVTTTTVKVQLCKAMMAANIAEVPNAPDKKAEAQQPETQVA